MEYRKMKNAQNEFTMEVAIDKTAFGEPVIYVDANRAGKTYTFGDFAQACDALEDWKQIAQVIVPAEGLWRHVRGFQTELKERKDRKSEQQKLAQRLARIRAGIELGARQRYQFEGEELERFNLHFEDTCRMTESALKAALQNEDMTLVAAHAKAKAKTEAKGEMRALYQKAKAKERSEVIIRAGLKGMQEVAQNLNPAILPVEQPNVPVAVEESTAA